MNVLAKTVARAAPSTVAASCGRCRYFMHSPSDLESALPGLSTLSSAYAAVRADDGLCAVHDRYLAATFSCDRFNAGI
jgi:hypothetical protein